MQSEDGIRDAHELLEFRRVLFRSGSRHVFPTHGKLADIALRDPAMPIGFELGAAGAAGNLLRDHRAAASYRVEGRKHACQLPHGIRDSKTSPRDTAPRCCDSSGVGWNPARMRTIWCRMCSAAWPDRIWPRSPISRVMFSDRKSTRLNS